MRYLPLSLIIGLLACLLRPAAGYCIQPEHPVLNAADTLFQQAQTALSDHRLLQAQNLLEELQQQFPEQATRQNTIDLWGTVMVHIVYSQITTPETVWYTVVSGDSLNRIAKKFHTTIELIQRSNQLSSSLIFPQQQLRIWAEPFSLHIVKSANYLDLSAGNRLIKRYHVATGRNNSTPTGTFTITSKMIDPVWYRPDEGEIVPGGDPRNCLGTRWLGLNEPQYGIHGTVRPDLIGQQVSHGCVRMLNPDVEELFELLPIGTTVTIVD